MKTLLIIFLIVVFGVLELFCIDFDPRSYGAKKLPDLFADLNRYFEVKKGANGVGIKAYRPKE
jgi:hypothetical protein